MPKFLIAALLFFAGTLCMAEETYYCLITDKDVKIAIADIDFLIASDSEPVFNAVLKNGEVCENIRKASFGKESYQGSGITESRSANVSIFPNPVKQTLHITCTESKKRSFEIYSTNGSLLRKAESDGNTTTLYVGDLPEGKYLLRTESTSLMFIKN